MIAVDQPESTPWYLYLLACADGTTYAGITTDPRRRLAEHNAGRGARYTSQVRRRPMYLLGVWCFPDQASATRAESCFKRRYKARKRQLAARRLPFQGAPFCPEYLEPARGEMEPHAPAPPENETG